MGLYNWEVGQGPPGFEVGCWPLAAGRGPPLSKTPHFSLGMILSGKEKDPEMRFV